MHYDIAIIGTGAGGGTLLHALAPTGKRILLLERGDYVPREKANWSTRAVNLEGRYNTKEVWRDRDGKPLHPHTNYYVGGNTKFYGAALFRLRREDFGEVKHWGGVSPAWPIGYEDLEPYYTAGRAPLPRARRAGRGPDRSARERAVPASGGEPRAPHPAAARRLGRGSGSGPSTCRSASCSTSSNPRASRCIRCETCDGHPCLVDAKSDAQVVCVDPALAAPERHAADRRLRRPARDQRVRPRGDARAWSKRGEADRDLLGGRGGGVGGRDQLGGAAAPVGQRPAPARARQRLRRGRAALHGPRQLGADGRLQVPEPDRLPEDARRSTTSTSARRSGSTRWGTSRSSASSTRTPCGRGAPAIAPGWTLDLMAKHSLDFWLTSEDLPDPDNRVTLDREGNIVLAYRPNNEDGAPAADRQARAAHEAADEVRRARPRVPRGALLAQPVPGPAHPAGGRGPPERHRPLRPRPARPRRWTCNCRAHEVDNLYVVDASFFPSSAAVNPALTIMANALRVADHLKSRLGI